MEEGEKPVKAITRQIIYLMFLVPLDIIFPKISVPWDPLGLDEVQSTFLEDGQQDEKPKPSNQEEETPKRPKEHPHRLLEWLHERLYDQQFISRRPTCEFFTFGASRRYI